MSSGITQEFVTEMAKLWLDLTLGPQFVAQIPEKLLNELYGAMTKQMKMALKDLDPVTAGFTERMMSDQMARPAFAMVVTLCSATKKCIDTAIISQITEQQAWAEFVKRSKKIDA